MLPSFRSVLHVAVHLNLGRVVTQLKPMPVVAHRLVRSVRGGPPRAKVALGDTKPAETALRGPLLSDYDIDDVWERPSDIARRDPNPLVVDDSASYPDVRKSVVPGMIDHDAPPSEPQDLLMERIKKAKDMCGLLNVVERHDRIMNHTHLLRMVDSITDLVRKNGFTDYERQELHSDPRFLLLCTRLIRSHRFMEAQPLLTVLKFLTFVKVPSQSRIMQTYLHLLRESVNELTLDGIMFAGRLLWKVQDNRLAAALLTALPIAFELRVEREMDGDNVQMISRILWFCGTFKIKNKVSRPVIEALKAKIQKDKSLLETMTVRQVGDLFIRLERANWFDIKLVEFLFDVLDRHRMMVDSLDLASASAFLRSVRYLRAKYPAEFHPDNRIHEIERKLIQLLPVEHNDYKDSSHDVQSFSSKTGFSSNPLAKV